MSKKNEAPVQAANVAAANGEDDFWNIGREVLVVAGLAVRPHLDVGERFRAHYVGAVTRKSRFGPVKLHIFQEPADGTAFGMWGSVALNEALGRVRRGAAVRLGGMGMLDLPGGSTMRIYRARVEEELAEVPSLSDVEKQAEAAGVFEALGIIDPNTGEKVAAVFDEATGEYA